MGPKHNSSGNRTRSTLSIFVVISLCCFFYLLGAWQRSGFGKGDKIAFQVTKQKDCNVFAELNSDLNFETHHNVVEIVEPSEPKAKDFKPCDVKYADYTPCQEQDRAMKFPRENMIYRERHCPPEEEKLRCLIPAREGYMTPFPWPKGHDYVHYANVPYKSLTDSQLRKLYRTGCNFREMFSNFQVEEQCSPKVQMHILMNLHQLFRLQMALSGQHWIPVVELQVGVRTY